MTDRKRVFFVRHGSPERQPGQFIGQTESPLTEQGKSEAARTGRWFADQGFSGVVYSSPLSRSYDTAQIIIDEIRKSNQSYESSIHLVDGLKETDFGLFDGKVSAEFQKEYPEEFAYWYSNPFVNSFPKGESFAECGKRFAQAVNSILEENKGNSKDILISAHMCSIQSYCVLAGLREFNSEFVENPIACASITAVDYCSDGSLDLRMWGWLPD